MSKLLTRPVMSLLDRESYLQKLLEEKKLFIKDINSQEPWVEQLHQCQCGVLIVKLRLQLKLQPWLGFAADLGKILGSALSSHSAHCVAASGICSAFINSRTSTTNAQTVKGLWEDTNLVLWGRLKTYFEQLNILGPKFLLNFW